MKSSEEIQTQSIEKFVEQAVASAQVWGLKNDLGWTVAMSNQYDDVQAYVFWTTQQLALACAKEEWETYKPTAIPLSEFLEDWCIGVFDENSLIGVEWTFDMCGSESEPMELAQAIVQELRKTNSAITFTKYKSLQALANLIDKAILDDQDFSGDN